jgi:hypothetical protein
MTLKESFEEKLEKLGRAIGSEDSLVENVMKRIETVTFSGSNRTNDKPLVGRFIKNPFMKIAAAAVVIIAVVLSVTIFDRSVPQAYGITDVPELFKKARVVHTQGWLYFNLTNNGQKVPREPIERWVDLENGRVRFSGVGVSCSPEEVKVTRSETVSDGQYKMILNHTDKYAVFYRMSDYQRMLEIHYSLNNMFGGLFVDIDNFEKFEKTGQEEMDGVIYDIWEAEVKETVTERRNRYKYWLSPISGQSGRFQLWYKNGTEPWRLGHDFYKIERDVDIPEGIFALEVPKDYEARNTKETAILLELDEGGSVGFDSLTLDPHISFTLSDGSVILAWRSMDRESATSQEELFESLEFGGALPKLPVEIYGLKPSGWTGEIAYFGQHLVYTQKGEKFVEWSLYIPDSPPPARNQMLGYDVLCKFNLEPQPNWRIASTVNYGIFIETGEEFDKWVLGAMAELSDDGKAPENITYEGVLRLSEQIRESFIE